MPKGMALGQGTSRIIPKGSRMQDLSSYVTQCFLLNLCLVLHREKKKKALSNIKVQPVLTHRIIFGLNSSHA